MTVEALKELEAKATQGRWEVDPTEECVSRGTSDCPPIFEIDHCAQLLTDDYSLNTNRILMKHENADACMTVEDATFVAYLVNAYRSGQLVYADSALSARVTELEAQNAAAVQAERERCAAIGYRVCAETRHVTLGQKVETAIREGE